MNNVARLAAGGLASLALLGTAFAGAGAVDARGGRPEVRVNGDCSGASNWKLKVKKEDAGKLETEFEVDQNVNGQRWRVILKNDRVEYFNAIRRTQAPSGSFSVEKLTNDGRGQDVITATARNLATGETCRASVKF